MPMASPPRCASRAPWRWPAAATCSSPSLPRATTHSSAAAGANNHCAAAGAWSTPVRRGDGQNLLETQPAGVTLAANRQFVFAADGSVAGGPVTISIGPHAITIDASGAVQGP